MENYSNLKILNQDCSNYEQMKSIIENEGIDVVFNLAVIPLPACLEKPAWTFKHNVDIAISLCELARNNIYDTLIHFSSSEGYGTSVYAPMDENHPLNGTTPYAASKASSDLLILSYCETFGIDASLIRPFNNYGPRQNNQSYASTLAKPRPIVRDPVVRFIVLTNGLSRQASRMTRRNCFAGSTTANTRSSENASS